ncbi:hypothetical protein KP509_19G067900 [Ceratopteris richardii]|uniref:Uncharacterized protein n=1 Tax=Ceratopteris richardii TaxID=49495 RepID=A0A8T2SN77_CERRI|nr:hypothetical protein KP509_19G067900 [Ceratopteris richardii]KAH7352861.1 hypothetical protein KP509_19G067900 [Ceratopteris richardii]KAH7352862.1 hypothetical protein KP509_19G067900 [Ceratopteris richardii]
MEPDPSIAFISGETGKTNRDQRIKGGNGDDHFSDTESNCVNGDDDDDDDCPEDAKANGFGHPFGWYLLLLDRHPVATKAVTSAFLTLFGDFICQIFIEKDGKINFSRLVIFTLLGLVLVGPTLHFWYLNLNKFIQGPGTVKVSVRLVLDQLLFSPIFIGIFLSALMTLEGHSSEIAPKLKHDWLGIVLANWKIWIPFQFLNFLLVPQQLQVLAANVIALVWNTYLSFAAHKDVMPQRDSITS